MTNDVLAHSVKLRPGLPSDIEPCARIVFNAFTAIAAQHNFPPDIPSIEVSTELVTMLLTHPHFFSVVAELDGKIVGSNFLDERSAIAGVGPITVDPDHPEPRARSPADGSCSQSRQRKSTSRRATAPIRLSRPIASAIQYDGLSSARRNRLHARRPDRRLPGRLPCTRGARGRSRSLRSDLPFRPWTRPSSRAA